MVEQTGKTGKAGMSVLISDEAIHKITGLARMDPLSPSMAIQKEHLKKILEYFSVLAQVDVSEVDPTIQVNPVSLPLRDDEPKNFLTRDEAMSNSRLRTDEYFLVPRILDHE